jgi:hypothetical protein
MPFRLILFALLALSLSVLAQTEPAWTRAADERGPMSTDEAKTFMMQLAKHAVEHHMKKAADSPQRV